MKSKLLVVGITTFFALASSCVPVPDETPNPVNTPAIRETSVSSTVTATVTIIPTLVSPTPAQNATATLPVTVPETGEVGREVTLVFTTLDSGRPYLVDERGRSLYIYSHDSPNSNASACIDDCAVEWPPLIVSEQPASGEGIDAAFVGTLSRDDGSTQATYNGWPLYYYIMDTIPGTMFGQNYNGVWFLISPAGEPIQR